VGISTPDSALACLAFDAGQACRSDGHEGIWRQLSVDAGLIIETRPAAA